MAVTRSPNSMSGATNVADLLERVLDKGVVIAGDIKISLLDIELLTIQLRLVVCSIDKAKEMGMDWWANSPVFGNASTPPSNQLPASSAASESAAPQIEAKGSAELDALQDRVRQLEQALAEANSVAKAEPAVETPRRFRPVVPPPDAPA